MCYTGDSVEFCDMGIHSAFYTLPNTVVLKPERVPESPGGLLKTQIVMPHLQSGVWPDEYLHV